MTSKYEKYRPVMRIGEGQFGVVTKYQGLEGDTIAIKKMFIVDSGLGVPSFIIREISLLKELDHENIVRLLDVISKGFCVELVFECLDFNLLQFIKTQPQAASNPSTIKKYLYQILRGVAHCHDYKILHRDLKPENLLIDSTNDIVKIADFGLARPCDVPLNEYTTKVATLYYMAPELLLGDGKYSSAIDIWAVACIFAEMVTHKYLFHGRGHIDQLLEILSIMGTPDQESLPQFTSFCERLGFFPVINSKDLAEVVPGLEPAGVDLLNKMLRLDPSKRITAREALEHKYFEDVNQNIS